MSEKKRIILLTQGGAGDILASTPMIRGFRKKYPDDEIIVTTTYSQLLDGNKNVDKVVPLSDPKDFYSEYVFNQNIRFFKKFFIYDHICDTPAIGCNSLPEFICNVYGVEYDGLPPDYFISDYEKRAAEVFMTQTDKKKILVHIFGATASDGGYGMMLCGGCGGKGIGGDGNKCQMCGGSGKVVTRQKTNNLKDLDPNIVAKVIEKNSDFDWLQIGLEGEPIIPGAYDCLGMSMRETIALIPHCASFIFIESLFAHAAGALQKTGVVVYQNTSSDFFGYPTAHVASDPGGCAYWPCNRPVGALIDFLPGYKNPKTKERTLWECLGRDCAKIKPDHLDKILKDSLKGPPRLKGDGGFNTLAEALKSGPPVSSTVPKTRAKKRKSVKRKGTKNKVSKKEDTD